MTENEKFSELKKLGITIYFLPEKGVHMILADDGLKAFKAGQDNVLSKMKICDIDSCENLAILKVCQEHTFEAGQESKEVMPEKCSECNDKLNAWIGSHTSVRIQTMGGTKWLCTNCWDKEERQKVLEHFKNKHKVECKC